jgi:integrase
MNSTRTYLTLSEAEMVRLLSPKAIPTPWRRNLVATALSAGLRKGELLALQKVDVDLPGKAIHVRRSHERDTTKGGHADTVPIVPQLVPFLADAIARSSSELVFPAANGGRRSVHTKTETIVRAGLKRAGIMIEGYDHTCRRCAGKGRPTSSATPSRTAIAAARRAGCACGRKRWCSRSGSTTCATRLRPSCSSTRSRLGTSSKSCAIDQSQRQ